MKPNEQQINRAIKCEHKKSNTFIDLSFTGIGVMCLDCRLLLKWIVEPDAKAVKEAELWWNKKKNQRVPTRFATNLDNFLLFGGK